MFNKKISFKLTVGFVTIVLVSILTIGIFFIQMFRQYTFENSQKTMMSRAHNIANFITQNTLENGYIRGFGGFIQFLDTLSEATVWITDSKGNPATITGMGMGMGMNGIKHTYSWGPLPEEAQKVINDVLSGEDSVSESFSSVYKETILTVGVPILNLDNKVTGAIFLHAPITGITQTLNKAESILYISLFGGLLLSIGLGIFYSMLFTRPLKAMNNVAIEMTRGNYSVRSGVDRKDELGQLGNSLDLLASKLGDTIDQLFQEKGKISDIISSISEGIVAFDTQLNTLSINNSLSDIMNRSKPYESEILKRDLTILGIYDSIKVVIEEKKSVQIIKDWQNKKLKFTLSPIFDKQSNVTGSVGLVADISESERLEQLRKDFVANVSHEFRTPLTIIKGSLEALCDGTVDQKDDVFRYYQRMLIEARSLERLVGDLLELSRLSSGKISINNEKVHIPSLLDDIIKSIQPFAINKQIQVEYVFSEETPPVIGDYDRLRQLFIIFLDNAIKYSPEKTKVNINIKIDESIHVTIQDHGYGIREEELPYIWERFYKTDKSRKSDGTGLGLSIAKHLIELQGGNVSLQSDVDIGTTVTITLPFKATKDNN